MKKITLFLFLAINLGFSQTVRLDSISNQNFHTYYTYNQENLNTNLYTFSINENDGTTIENEINRDYIYDSNGKIIERISDHISDNNKNKFTYSYDTNDLLIEKIIYDWDFSNSLWVEEYKTTYNYLSSGKLNFLISYYKSNNQWETSNKTVYTYTNDLLSLAEDFTFTNGAFEQNAHRKSEYQYNANNKIETNTDLYILDNSWVNESRTIYTYDNVNQNIISDQYQNWNSDSNSWDTSSSTNYVYDNNFTLSDLILPYEFYSDNEVIIYFNHKLTSVNFDSSNIELYYSSTTASTNDFSEEMVAIYPNPFEDGITINLKNSKINQIKITDIQGRTVYQNNFLSNEKINLNQLQEGAYFYTINNVLKGKLIKK